MGLSCVRAGGQVLPAVFRWQLFSTCQLKLPPPPRCRRLRLRPGGWCRLLLDDPGGKGGEGGGGGETEDDVFLKKIESSMLAQVKLQGISGIRKVFLREAKRTRLDPAGGGFVTDNEWVLDTEGALCGGADGCCCRCAVLCCAADGCAAAALLAVLAARCRAALCGVGCE